MSEDNETKVAVHLTERQWDHVVISLELSMSFHEDLLDRQNGGGIPSTGLRRAIGRYHDIHDEMVEELGWAGD